MPSGLQAYLVTTAFAEQPRSIRPAYAITLSAQLRSMNKQGLVVSGMSLGGIQHSPEVINKILPGCRPTARLPAMKAVLSLQQASALRCDHLALLRTVAVLCWIARAQRL